MTREEATIIIGNIPINPDTMDDCFTIAEYQEAKTMAIEALEQRWIPVSEQLPEADGYYLVTLQRNLLTRTEQYTDISEFRDGSWTEYGNIIAWCNCKLPTPYKEVEDADSN